MRKSKLVWQMVEPSEDPATHKGLTVDLPSGASVYGCALDTGGFQWEFISDSGVKTVIRLSDEGLSAVIQIAKELSRPGSIEAA